MKRKISLVSSILVLAGCKTLLDDSDKSKTKVFPTDQLLNFTIDPTIKCDTASVGNSVELKHPQTGEPLKLEYKNSDQIDYLNPDWEKRIPMTSDFFSTKNMAGYTPDEMKATVIDIRNVNGKPSYHYFSNGTALQTVQNLSATKFMGASFSVHRLRQQSKGKIGADVRYNSRVLASDFDIIGNKSDNNYAAAVKMIGGSKHADNMLENWMLAGKRDASVSGSGLDTFGGTWGAGSDYCKGFDYPAKKVKDLVTGEEMELAKQERSSGNWTHISGLTFAEWLKRIAVNYRDPQTMPKMIDYNVNRKDLASVEARKKAKPSLTKRDLQLLMYGTAAYSDKEFKDRGLMGSDCGGSLGATYSMHEGTPRGGMMWDGLRDWPHNAGGVDRLNKLFGKKWRTLGKGGSSDESQREAVSGYICLPKIVKKGKVVFPGRELVIHMHFKNRHRPGHNFTHVHNAAKAVIDQMVPGLVSGGKLHEIGQGKLAKGTIFDGTTPVVTDSDEETVAQERTCAISFPKQFFSSLPIWKTKNPLRTQVGQYSNGDEVKILGQDGNILQTPKGFINATYTKDCRG